MRFLSVCSGIEAASVAWNPLGWKAAALAEIEPFPSAVLAHHYPNVPNHGDMTKFKDWPDHAIDLVCGGTPCQSFSNAGLRAGLDDPRGQLMLTFGAIAARYRPRWLVWENVPGVLSSNGGRDFGAFLGLLGFLGYGYAYRVLDAQFVRVDGYPYAVPQRRNRVFVVGCLGDWRSAAAVLLERESLRGDSAPRRSAGARVAATLTRGAESSGRGGYAGRRQEDDTNIVVGALAGNGPGAGWRIGPDEAAANQLIAFDGQNLGVHDNVSGTLDTGAAHTNRGMHVALCLNAKGGGGRLDAESETLIPTNGGRFDVAHTLRGDGFDASEDGTGRGTPLIAFDTTQITSAENRCNPKAGDPCHPLAAHAHAHAPAIAFNARQDPINGPINGPIDTDGTTAAVLYRAAVRRLMPVECERLQGFKDGYTAIQFRGKPAADGPRYKAIGNSWAIPPVRWIGKRIDMVDAIRAREAA
jgi:DNA (cytosine-5)-methyltransferase 1